MLIYMYQYSVNILNVLILGRYIQKQLVNFRDPNTAWFTDFKLPQDFIIFMTDEKIVNRIDISSYKSKFNFISTCNQCALRISFKTALKYLLNFNSIRFL